MVGWIKRIFGKRYDVYKCDACNGKGIVKSKTLIGYENCTKCQGTGKLDWVERVVGKSPPVPVSFTGGSWLPTSVPNLTFRPPNCSFKPLTMRLEVLPHSIRELLLLLYNFDIFIEIGKLSIPFLKSIVVANVVVWIVLFLAR
jgi:hypothetical protein